jgi:hypothetical protein
MEGDRDRSTYGVDAAVVGDAGDSTSAGPHGGNHGPLVGLRVVNLDRAYALPAVESSGYVNLTCVRVG